MITKQTLIELTGPVDEKGIATDRSDSQLMRAALLAGLGLLASIYEGDEPSDSPAVETLSRGNPYAHLYAREIGADATHLEEPPKAK